MPEHDPHSSPIKTPKQLVIVVLLAFLVPITVIALLSQLFTSSSHTASKEDEQRVLERIKPAGTVVIAEASGPKGSMTGEQVYAQICKTCHEAGLARAPKSGDKAAWQPRIAQGEKTLVQHAIAGFQGKSGVMPPKGGNADLTDDEVHRAVVFLANQVGAGWKEPAATATAAASAAPAVAAASTAPVGAKAAPAAPAAAAAPAATASAAPTQVATAAPAAAAGAGKADGKSVYDQTCHVCHEAGVAGSPKYGDKAAWAPRIAQGADTLYSVALHGKGAMPPKGGNAALSDAQVKAAVDYMVAAAK